MLRNDYIMRIIEQFINAMALIRRYQKGEEYERALQTAGDTFQKLFGAGSDFFNSLSEQDLLNLLKTNGTLDKDKTIIIATLLKMEGDLFEARHDTNEARACASLPRYLKSLNLYLESYLCENACAHASLSGELSEIDGLIQKLSQYELPGRTKNRLWQYYERLGKYSRAEDLLYDLYEDSQGDNIFEQGIAFYDRLLQKSDQQLNAGDLPRDEVEDGRAQWLTFKNEHA